MAMTPQKKTGFLLLGVAATMLSLSFAAVPFYDWFCRVTGFGGTTSVAAEGSDLVLDRTVLVRFDASKEAGMPWDFKPQQHSMRIRIGETGLAFYEAHNPTAETVAGTASYNVTPDSAGGYFTKIDCFCFQMQVLAPGETAIMPVSFYVDPEMVKDREGKFVREITLSYTFHRTEIPAEQAALAPAGEDAASGAVN
ncbi:MAG: cytochrome c oxidase assembly protein [Rhodobacteraceae bacterium GWE1_64_9]|nr:MAG: cytochrome c oxidase assembly protein [Rhodobacteraceae bacterium GWE1_64_9]OHC49710.1 MAG: cytochrome c oxidase assembly protein [Rhodobacteraceae bacterium GWF1_65_7]HBD89937.1 cytochrome c oxidase assembly protein [Gemmobacter sp.]HBU14644.1 cytochrome c oxidase assembly protein [Gemmobacter sp.]